MEDYTTPLCFKCVKYHDFAKYFSSLFLPNKTSLHPAMISTVIPVFSNTFIFHDTAYTFFRCHMDTDHFCQPLEFAENSCQQALLEKGLYMDYSVCIPAGSDLINP